MVGHTVEKLKVALYRTTPADWSNLIRQKKFWLGEALSSLSASLQ
jgi:hypothetical protein